MTPDQETHYRAQTARQSSMPGVTLGAFRCVRCCEYRRLAGRRRVEGRWVCALCVAQGAE